MSRTRRVLPPLAAAGLAGCEAPYSSLLPGGPEASALATLAWLVIALMLLITTVMAILVVAGALRRRGSLQEHLPIDIAGGRRWVLIGGALIPALVLTALFFVSVGTLRGIPGDEPDPDLDVVVTGHRWWWEVEYAYPELQQVFATANELHIPVGRKVRIRLESADVIHSFWVPRLHGKLDAIPGHTNYLVLEADQPGVYRGECAEYCGAQHAHMGFRVVAEPEPAFLAWAAQQRRPASPVSEPQLVKGREAFEQYACALCHTVRGTRARGQVAPDLTHIGSRLTIAGSLPHTRARLQAWIVDAQALKPGVYMPSLEVFDGETLDALASYLESLK